MPAPKPRILWLAAWLAAAACSAGNDDRGWPVYGADGATSRYSPLDEIDASNFARLTTAWTWESADLAWREAWEQRWKKPPKTDLTDFQLTPLVIGRVLYGITSLGFAFALEADTGRELWVTDLGA